MYSHRPQVSCFIFKLLSLYLTWFATTWISRFLFFLFSTIDYRVKESVVFILLWIADSFLTKFTFRLPVLFFLIMIKPIVYIFLSITCPFRTEETCFFKYLFFSFYLRLIWLRLFYWNLVLNFNFLTLKFWLNLTENIFLAHFFLQIFYSFFKLFLKIS